MTPVWPDLVGWRGLPSVLTDPVLAPDLRTNYICLARLCDAVSSTTGSRWFARLLGFPSPVCWGRQHVDARLLSRRLTIKYPARRVFRSE